MSKSTPRTEVWPNLRQRIRELVVSGDTDAIATLLTEQPDLQSHEQLLIDCIYAEFCFREEQQQTPQPAEYLKRFPGYTKQLQALFAANAALDTPGLMGAMAGDTQQSAEKPADGCRTDDYPTILSAAKDAGAANDSTIVRTHFGRYRIETLLGSGGFGEVYKALDEQLRRSVAVKVTLQKFVRADSKEAYLAEAQTVAGLDHPHIVPVYDVGQADSGDYYVVSKLVEGSDLAARIRTQRPALQQSVKIVASIADALHYAHTKGLVHRDVKPANILIDAQNRAFLADFGIALSEEQLGRGAEWAGTVSYMSPEQARGESHRVDGRSDIYSLGVVLYELLTGRRPFQTMNTSELLTLVANKDVRPPRQIDDTIPQELERICLKALNRSLNERYSTAKDFAEDLCGYLKLPPASDWRSTPTGKAFNLSTSFGNRGCSLAVVLGVLVMLSAGHWAKEWQAWNERLAVNQSPPIEATAFDDIVINRFDMLVSREKRQFRPIAEMLPLQTGDHVRFSIELNQAAYARLIWIDAEGNPGELFPADPETGSRSDDPVTTIESPVQLDRGWPVEGRGGMETAILLVSREPLSGIADDVLRMTRREADSFAAMTEYQASRSAAPGPMETKNSVVMSTRGLGHKSGQVDDAVLNLLETLRQQSDLVQAISVMHEDKP